jgi:nitrite reductase/ring-hydroxylating ferredoxin subunit
MLGAFSGCQTAKEKEPVVTTGVVNIGPSGNFPAGTANTVFQAKYGIVVVNDSGTPLAIRPQCTFAPAPLKWDPRTVQFVCAAHGCRFDLLGRVTKGPATRNLGGVVAQPQADGTLTVDLNKLYGM